MATPPPTCSHRQCLVPLAIVITPTLLLSVFTRYHSVFFLAFNVSHILYSRALIILSNATPAMAFISFSTNDFAPNERLEAAQDIYSAIAQVQLDAPKKQTPHVETRIKLLPGISIANVTASSLHAARKSPQVVDGNDDITFLIHPGGQGGWLSHLQAHDTLACTPGRARIVLNHQSGSVDFHGERVNFLSVAFSRAQLAPLIHGLDRVPKTLLPPSEPLQHIIRIALSLTHPKMLSWKLQQNH